MDHLARGLWDTDSPTAELGTTGRRQGGNHSGLNSLLTKGTRFRVTQTCFHPCSATDQVILDESLTFQSFSFVFCKIRIQYLCPRAFRIILFLKCFLNVGRHLLRCLTYSEWLVMAVGVIVINMTTIIINTHC